MTPDTTAKAPRGPTPSATSGHDQKRPSTAARKTRAIARMAPFVVLGGLALAGLAAALVSDANVGNQRVADEDFTRVHVFNATLENGSINHTSIHDSMLVGFAVQDATLRWTYHEGGSVDRILAEDSRLDGVSVQDSTLRDTTLCEGGQCRLVSGQKDGSYEALDEHARLVQDAPAMVRPNETYDLRIEDADGQTLMVTNDPSGSTALGFDNRAPDGNVEALEMRWEDGNRTFALGESVPMPARDFTLRVHVAETGIIDGATLGLVLSMDGHGLRPAITTLNVTATQLAFAPVDQQAFAPFLADNVARLVISQATDAAGNVDRDPDVAYTANVQDVGSDRVVGDIQAHVGLHGDAEFFSDEPFGYNNPTSLAAHHPATLESILRDTVGVEGITYGAAQFHATHLVAQSPYETTVELTATTTVGGRELRAEPITIVLAPQPDDRSSASTPFGPLGDPMFPGDGTLRVRFVDGDGDAVEAGEGWTLSIQETPDSHRTTMRLSVPEGDASMQVQLAESPLVGLPFGDFFPHEYQVCLDQGGERSCANGGDLVAIRDDETTEVTITVA